jgi:hypothetical protein
MIKIGIKNLGDKYLGMEGVICRSNSIDTVCWNPNWKLAATTNSKWNWTGSIATEWECTSIFNQERMRRATLLLYFIHLYKYVKHYNKRPRSGTHSTQQAKPLHLPAATAQALIYLHIQGSHHPQCWKATLNYKKDRMQSAHKGT